MNTSNRTEPSAHGAATRRRLAVELAIVLAVTFGMSGLRATLRLINAVASPTPLAQQTTTLHANQSQLPWLDLALQVASAGTLFAWAALAVYLLHLTSTRLAPFRPRDLAWGLMLAAVIGIPGLGFYVAAVKLGYSTEVVPTTLEHLWWEVPVLLLYSLANAVAEEVVVVGYCITRLRQLGTSPWLAVLAMALLRGSYHLYQGFSAGGGNVVMGLLFGWVFLKYGKVWPLVAAHFFIDAVAFVGYSALGGNLSFLGF